MHDLRRPTQLGGDPREPPQSGGASSTMIGHPSPRHLQVRSGWADAQREGQPSRLAPPGAGLGASGGGGGGGGEGTGSGAVAGTLPIPLTRRESSERSAVGDEEGGQDEGEEEGNREERGG